MVCFCAENEIAEFKIFTSRPFKLWFWIKRFSSFAFLSNFSLSVYVPRIDEDNDDPDIHDADTTADHGEKRQKKDVFIL